jgi:hypothetical protein
LGLSGQELQLISTGTFFLKNMLSIWFGGEGILFQCKNTSIQGLIHNFYQIFFDTGCLRDAKKSQKSYSRGDRGGSLIDFLQKPNDFLVFLGTNNGGFILIFHK